MAELLKFLSADDENRLLVGAEHRSCLDNEVIVVQGDTRHALNILRRGQARVERQHEGFSVEISRLAVGEIFGEMSFVEDFEASASVVADGNCDVDVIPGDFILKLLDSEPEFAARFYHSIAELLSRRLRATTVAGVSEFSWGSGFERASQERKPEKSDAMRWGGGSPLRDALEGNNGKQ